MSPTATEATTTEVPTTDVPVYTRPTLEDVVSAIMAEMSSCPHEAALEFVEFMARAVQVGNRTRAPYNLTDEEAYGPIHDILGTVMPDRATAVPGSAHDLLQRHLAPEGSVMLLTHDREMRFVEGDRCQIVVATITTRLTDG